MNKATDTDICQCIDCKDSDDACHYDCEFPPQEMCAGCMLAYGQEEERDFEYQSLFRSERL